MKTDRKKLLACLEAVAPGIVDKAVVAQSDCVVFTDEWLCTFNDEVCCHVANPVPGLAGAVRADKSLALMRKLTEDVVDLEVAEGHLIVKGKGRKSGIRMEEDVILPVESVGVPENWSPLHEDFSEGVGIVQHCAGRDESRFVLTCIHIHPEWVVAADGNQVCRYPMKTGFEKEFLVRRDSLRHVVGMKATEFCETDEWVHFRNESGAILSCRRIMEQYPEAASGVFKIDGEPVVLPEGLGEAVVKAGIFTGDEFVDFVTVGLEKDRLRLEGRGSSGWYREMLPVEYSGEPVKFQVVPSLLLEIVKRSRECEISARMLKVTTDNFIFACGLKMV